MDLAVPLVVFLASAAAVWVFGTRLATYGEALATLTGLGRLFVGSILIALATSLPELSTNISAVRLDPPNPQLAVGNVLGANMLDMFILALVALLFGGRRFLRQVAPQQGYLIVLAAVMTGIAVLLGALKLDISLWKVGLSSLILLVIYVVGMWVVYQNRPETVEGGGEADVGSVGDPLLGLRRAWVMFGLVAAGVLIAGISLAWSTDRIAEVTGVSSSTLGILAVSFVTTLPELSSAIGAARIGAMDLGVAGLFGSAVFNASILAMADPFFREGILVNQTEPAHIVAGSIAFGLILAGLALILARNRIPVWGASLGLGLMACFWVAGAVVVSVMGGT